MSIPTTALANIRAVKSWTEKPFTEFNDTATTIYYFECVCLSSVYESNKLAKGAKLSSAANAGLIATQYIDASARWVGDSNFSYSDGGYIRFTRRFSRVPTTHEDYSSTVVTLPPIFGKDRERFVTVTSQPATTTSAGGPDITSISYGPEFEYVKKASQSSVERTRLVFNYSTNPAALPIYNAGSFSIVQVDGFSTVIREGLADVLESTKITRWNGDIFQAVTAFAL